MINNIRQSGCVVNHNIAIAIGKGVVLANDRTLLEENGGSLNLNFSSCHQFFMARPATTAKQPVSLSFLKEMGFSFHQSIKKVVDAYNIPDDLGISIDQTSLPFILLCKYTTDKKKKQACTNRNFCLLSSSYRNLLNYPLWYFFTYANNLSRSHWPLSS